MSKDKLSVLVSYPDHFEVTEITRDLEQFQKLVGGYIEAVPRPTAESGWFAYCNEEGKYQGLPINVPANRFLNALFNSEGAPPFTNFDTVVGNLIWFSSSDEDESDEASIPVEYVQRYALVHLTDAWQRRAGTEPVITVLRDGQDIWVFDQLTNSLIPQHVAACVRSARSRPEHGTIEVYCISPEKWVELRVELMDDVTGIRIHDERDDKSYG